MKKIDMKTVTLALLCMSAVYLSLPVSAQSIQVRTNPYRDPRSIESEAARIKNLSASAGAYSAVSSTWAILPTDVKLAVTFERWAKTAGMKLIWDAQQHVMLSSADSFDGTLDEALTRVLSSSAIKQSSYPLEACIYPNNPPVLRITRLGEQKECTQ